MISWEVWDLVEPRVGSKEAGAGVQEDIEIGDQEPTQIRCTEYVWLHVWQMNGRDGVGIIASCVCDQHGVLPTLNLAETGTISRLH